MEKTADLLHGRPVRPIRLKGREIFYYNLPDHPEKIAEFLSFSPDRKVPVVVENGQAIIGYGGT